MRYLELLSGVPDILAIAGPAARGDGTPLGRDSSDPDISGIVSDSRLAHPGALFVAYRGVGVDGHRFIADAIARGAAAIVGDAPPAPLPVPYAQAADGRAALAWLSAAWHGHPSRSLALVGITGTDGKTTTANLIFSILRAAGRRSGLISTSSGAVIGERVIDTGLHTTTPDAPDVQRTLAEMWDAGAEIAVLEVTSHGLAQHRVTGCEFDVAVITNITHEHLDFHGSFEGYRDAKAMLFRGLGRSPASTWGEGERGKRKPRLPKTAVLNRDDASYGFLANIATDRIISYRIEGVETFRRDVSTSLRGEQPSLSGGPLPIELVALDVQAGGAGMSFQVRVTSHDPNTDSGQWRLVTPLVGLYNVHNVLAAAGAALALGIPPGSIQAGVAALSGISGRQERIDRGQEFLAMVDFAHTPNALEHALRAARALAGPGSRVIVVFGCAGLRDIAKRRLMGDVAARLADLTVITAEDPRTESLSEIMNVTAAAMTAAGKLEGLEFVQIRDRQRAILYAVCHARPGDVVMVCGKGHERSMCFGSVEYSWRDQDALIWALGTLGGGAPLTQPPYQLPTWLEE